MEGRSNGARRCAARHPIATSGRYAFTLIEMVVVTAIIALMAALIIPNLVSIRQAQLFRANQAAILRFPAQARDEALRSHAPVILRVDNDSLVIDRITVDTQDSSTPSGQSGPAPMLPPDPKQSPQTEEVKRLQLPSDISVDTAQENGQPMDSGTWQWVVYPDGSAESAGITFVIGGERRTLWIPASNPDGGNGISVNTSTSGGSSTGSNLQPEGAQWVNGEIPDTSGDSWSAGELEQRTTGSANTGSGNTGGSTGT